MPADGFETFGTPHLVAMALTLALPALLAVLARRLSGAAPTVIAWLLAGMLLANEFTYWSIRIGAIGLDGWVRNHMPLHVCGVAVLLTSATLLFRSPKTYEIVYFWGLVGSANAVITPGGLAVDFPEYRFFQYFIAHSGIVVGVLFATWGLGMRPTLRGMFRAFAYLAVFAAFVGAVNLLLGSNFMWLSGASPGHRVALLHGALAVVSADPGGGRTRHVLRGSIPLPGERVVEETRRQRLRWTAAECRNRG